VGDIPVRGVAIGSWLPIFLMGEKTLLSILQAAGWPIWSLVLCSVIALTLVIERFFSLQLKHVAPPHLLDEVIALSRFAPPAPDLIRQLQANCALGEVLASGLMALHSHPRSPDAELRAVVEGTGRQVAQQLEKYLPALATVASVAPLLGLLGTVIGMIEIFGAQNADAASGSNPAQLAHGISVALYNTAAGLMVAIPSLVFWRYFRARVDRYVLTMELASERFMHHLSALNRLAQTPRRESGGAS